MLPRAGEAIEVNSEGEKRGASTRGGGAERLFVELLREPNDLMVAGVPGPSSMILLVTGAGDIANEANVGGGEPSEYDWLYRATGGICCREKPGEPDPEGESKFELLCFLLNSLLNKLRLPGAGEGGGDIVAKDDAGDADGTGVGSILEREMAAAGGAILLRGGVECCVTVVSDECDGMDAGIDELLLAMAI